MLALNNSVIKSTNASLILKLILSGDAVTRQQLAKMSITNIVSSLIADGLIEEKLENSSSKIGRPIGQLSVSSSGSKVIGVIIQNNQVNVCLLDIAGHTCKDAVLELPEFSQEALLPLLFSKIDDLIRSSLGERIVALSVVGGDCLDSKNGIWQFGGKTHSLPMTLLDELGSRYQLPVFADNYWDSMLYIEKTFGNAKGFDNCMLVHLDDAIASALCIDGKILKNKTGITGSIAHVSIDYNGLSCSCGNRGCLQSYISTEAMEKKMRDITKLKLDFQGFCDTQLKKNDSRIDWAFKDMMDKLGFALISMLNVIDTPLIIISGKGSHIPDRYLQKLEKTVASKKINPDDTLQIKKSQLIDTNRNQLGIAPYLSSMIG